MAGEGARPSSAMVQGTASDVRCPSPHRQSFVKSAFGGKSDATAWHGLFATPKEYSSEDADSCAQHPAQTEVGELGGWRNWWHEWRLGTGGAKRYAAATASQAPQSSQPQQDRIDEKTLRRLRRYHRQSFAATWLVMITPWALLGIALHLCRLRLRDERPRGDVRNTAGGIRALPDRPGHASLAFGWPRQSGHR